MDVKDSGFEDAVETVFTAYTIFAETIMHHDFKHTAITKNQREAMLRDYTKQFECMIEQNFFAYREGTDKIYKFRTCDVKNGNFNFKSAFIFQEELEEHNPDLIKYFSRSSINKIYQFLNYSEENLDLLREFIIPSINAVNLIIGIYRVLTEMEEFQDELEFRLGDVSYKAMLSCMITTWWRVFTAESGMQVEVIDEFGNTSMQYAQFIPAMYVDDNFTVFVDQCNMSFNSKNFLE